MVEKNIQPWMLVNVSSRRSTLNHNRPDMRPKPIVCTQLSLESICGRATVKFLLDNTLNWVQKDVGHLEDSSQPNSPAGLLLLLLPLLDACVLCDACDVLSDHEDRPLSSSSLAVTI